MDSAAKKACKYLATLALSTLLWMTPASAEEEFSPRGFCTTRGGEVLETGDPDIHICCYSSPTRCVSVNGRTHTSILLENPEKLSGSRPRRKLVQVE